MDKPIIEKIFDTISHWKKTNKTIFHFHLKAKKLFSSHFFLISNQPQAKNQNSNIVDPKRNQDTWDVS